jgi:predicted SAM-dependent methyltransferase
MIMATLNLHIGGQSPHPDWKILDIEARPEVDYVADAANLSQFSDNSVDKIYASHVLEHFFYCLNNELLSVLQEWHRVLKPNGLLMISVPNLKILCWLFLNPELKIADRIFLMRVIFGGQINQYDVHKVGFNFEILASFLQKVGFQDYWQVDEFIMFDDCSRIRILDIPISLNVVAKK